VEYARKIERLSLEKKMIMTIKIVSRQKVCSYRVMMVAQTKHHRQDDENDLTETQSVLGRYTTFRSARHLSKHPDTILIRQDDEMEHNALSIT